MFSIQVCKTQTIGLFSDICSLLCVLVSLGSTGQFRSNSRLSPGISWALYGCSSMALYWRSRTSISCAILPCDSSEFFNQQFCLHKFYCILFYYTWHPLICKICFILLMRCSWFFRIIFTGWLRLIYQRLLLIWMNMYFLICLRFEISVKGPLIL